MEIPSVIKGSVLKAYLKKKGDLATAMDDGQLETISVGPDGAVLTADSSNPTGVKWVSGANGSAAWGSIVGNLGNQIDLKGVLQNKADVTHAHTASQVGLGNVTDDAQVKKAAASVDGNLVAWSGTAGDTVVDSGKKLSDLALAAHRHDELYEPADANIQSHLSSTANPHNVSADQVVPNQTGNNGKFLTTNGATVSWADAAAGTPPSGNGFRHITDGAEDAVAKLVADADVAAGAAIAESKLNLNYATHANNNDPTAGEKEALTGTSGTPGTGNRYVTDADPRNTDSRTPTVHGSSAHTGIIGTPDQIGLGNVPNLDTSNPANILQDANHRFTTDAEKTNWNGKQNALGFTPVPATRLVAGHQLSADVILSKNDVGLGNVDNTSDADKPISIATQTALNGKQDSLPSRSDNANKYLKVKSDESGYEYDMPAGDALPIQTGQGGKFLTTNGSNLSWGTPTGSGDMLATTYDPTHVAADAFNRANHNGTQPMATISDAGNAATKNVGPGANDVAAGNHNHIGTYELANANIQTHIGATSGNPHQVTKADVGLGNCDNTSDANKPVSTLTQAALDGKSNVGHNHVGIYEPANANIQNHIGSTSNPHSVTASQLGLGNITNDAQLKRAAGDFGTFTEKATPVSADLILIEDSAAAGAKKSVRIGNLPGGTGASVWGDITGTLNNQTDLNNALATKEATANKGIANGYAGLGSDGKVPTGQLPAGLPSAAAWGAITEKPHITVGDVGYGSSINDLIGALTAIGTTACTLVIPKGATCTVTPLYSLSVVCNVSSADKKITRASGSWVDDGVKIGHWIEVLGGVTPNTNGYKRVNSVSATELIVDEGMGNESSITLSIVNKAVIPANVTLQVERGGMISMGSREILLFFGGLNDCVYKIFEDSNTYDYSKRTLTGASGSPTTFTLASHGLQNGDLVYLCTNRDTTGWHHFFYVSDAATDTFKLKYQDKTTYLDIAGAFASGDNVVLAEAFGAKFMSGFIPFARPEWWGGAANNAATHARINNTAFNHAIHNSALILYSGNNLDSQVPVQLSSGSYYINGRLYMMPGSSLMGVERGFASPFMYKTYIQVSDSSPAVGSFIYVWNIGEVSFKDFYLAGPGDSATCKKGFEVGGDQWHSNGTKFERVGVAGFAPGDTVNGWGIYCHEGTSYITRIVNCGIGSNGNGVRVETDSEILVSNFVGNGKGMGIQNVGAQIRDCVVEVWGIGIKNELGGMITGCLIKQIADGVSVGRCIDLGNVNYQVTISNNILSTSYAGIYCAGDLVGCVITGNQFDHIGHQAPAGYPGYGIEAKGFAGCTVTGNVFGKCRFGPVHLISPSVSSQVGNWHDNFGIDVNVAKPYPLTYYGQQSFQPVAIFSNKLGTNNLEETRISYFNISTDEGREFSVTLNDRNTRIQEWLEAQSGLLPYIVLVKNGTWDDGGWNYYHQNSDWNIFHTTVQAGDSLYLGTDDSKLPIGLRLFIKTPSIGNTVVAEYWDGFEWVNLPTIGSPNMFDKPGWQSVRWMPPPFKYDMTAGAFANLTVTVNASERSFYCDGIESFMQPWTVGDRAWFKKGDWLITSGFDNSANNGKFLITAIDRYKITCGGAASLVDATNDTGATLKQTGFTNCNLNQGSAIGVPAGGPNAAGKWIRLRVTATNGGSACVVGNYFAQYNLINLKDGDFGPLTATDALDKETIHIRSENGSFVEIGRTTVKKPVTLINTMTVAAGTTAGKMKSTTTGRVWSEDSKAVYAKTATNDLWDLTALKTASGQYAKAALCLDIEGNASVVMGDWAASQAAALIPKVSKSLAICGVVELPASYNGGAISAGTFYDTPGLTSV